MLYMVIETFRDANAAAIYRRFHEKGRMQPEGLKYVDSWVQVDRCRCFQLIECDDRKLFDQWLAHWEDLMEFEIVPVQPSREVAAAYKPEWLDH